MTTTEKTAISIKRTFNLPLKTVWKAWSEVDSFKKWWGPKDYTCPHCTIDFKEGGKFWASMKGPDGKETWSVGEYQEIVPMEKITYSDSFADNKGKIVPASYYDMPGEWDLALPVTIEFEEVDDDKTRMTLRHEGIPADMQEDCTVGWQQCFDKLESNLK